MSALDAFDPTRPAWVPPQPTTDPETLLHILATYTLRPDMGPAEVARGEDVEFSGACYDVSATFRVRVPADSPECAALRAAVADHVTTPRYLAAEEEVRQYRAARAAREAGLVAWARRPSLGVPV